VTARRHALPAAPPALPGRSRLRAGLAAAGAVIAAWRQRHRYRCDLRRLLRSGPHLIDDIGLTRSDAEREAAKPIWRP
jgi:uncharacterized protein YjiS (DUF1127 family)